MSDTRVPDSVMRQVQLTKPTLFLQFLNFLYEIIAKIQDFQLLTFLQVFYILKTQNCKSEKKKRQNTHTYPQSTP